MATALASKCMSGSLKLIAESSLSARQQADAKHQAGYSPADMANKLLDGNATQGSPRGTEDQTGAPVNQVAGIPAHDAGGTFIGTETMNAPQVESLMHIEGLTEEDTWQLMDALDKGQALRAPLHNELKLDLQYKVQGMFNL